MYDLEQNIKRDEGLRLKPYRDSNGILTIGYGHNLEYGITKKQAEMILKSDIENASKALINTFPWIVFTTPVNKFNALIELTFWIGIDSVKGFKNMLAALKNQHWTIAAEQLMDSALGRNFTTRAQRLANVIKE